MKVNKWDIVFVQDCNLRCSYCSTGYGRFAESQPRELERARWDDAIAFMAGHAEPRQTLQIDFQGGETFMRFESFIEFVKKIKNRFQEFDVYPQIHVATNGVLLDHRRLSTCREMGIHLYFSIDGEKKKHDLHRRDRAGRGTFQRAFDNWRQYAQLAASDGRGMSCGIKSVATAENGLADIVHFWNSQGVDVIDVILEDKSFFTENGTLQAVDRRRNDYLRDLRAIAAECASRGERELFLTHFKGPMILFSIWEMILKDSKAEKCSAGKDMLAVDPGGNLFPCNGFVGRPRWQVGNVVDGVDGAALKRFLLEKERAFAVCSGCSVRQFCNGGCPANADDQVLRHHSPGGCEFMKQLIGIAESSFRSMCK